MTSALPTGNFENFLSKANEKREAIKQQTRDELKNAGLKFTEKSDGGHLLISSPLGLIDYFPLSAKWVVRQTGTRGFDAWRVIELIKNCEKNAAA